LPNHTKAPDAMEMCEMAILDVIFTESLASNKATGLKFYQTDTKNLKIFSGISFVLAASAILYCCFSSWKVNSVLFKSASKLKSVVSVYTAYEMPNWAFSNSNILRENVVEVSMDQWRTRGWGRGRRGSTCWDFEEVLKSQNKHSFQ